MFPVASSFKITVTRFNPQSLQPNVPIQRSTQQLKTPRQPAIQAYKAYKAYNAYTRQPKGTLWQLGEASQAQPPQLARLVPRASPSWRAELLLRGNRFSVAVRY
jgi:hypothetical protein